MSVIQYSVNGASLKHANYLNPRPIDDFEDAWDYEQLAQEAAEDYWENHDGWESRWPLNIELFADGSSVGMFEVVMETEPTFSASKKEQAA
ncbi:TPA: hypothetical protein ACNVXV_002074 [Citrobacter koseri]